MRSVLDFDRLVRYYKKSSRTMIKKIFFRAIFNPFECVNILISLAGIILEISSEYGI